MEEPITVRIFDTNEIERWFLKIENDPPNNFRESYTRTFFYQIEGSILIIQKNKNGIYSLSIYFLQVSKLFLIFTANLLVGAQFQNIPPKDLSGITHIDEI